MNTVSIEGKPVATTGTDHAAVSETDMILVDSKPPAVDYVNDARSKNVTGSPGKTFIRSEKIWTEQSVIPVSKTTPEAPAGVGETSGTWRKETKAIATCQTVFVEGQKVIRLQDPTEQNHKNCAGKVMTGAEADAIVARREARGLSGGVTGGVGGPAAPVNPFDPNTVGPNYTPIQGFPIQDPTIRTAVALVNRGCGGYQWRIFFDLPNPTTTGGWLVQEFLYTNTRTDAQGNTTRRNYHYWEAWEVLPGQTAWGGRATHGFDDSFASSPYPGTTGSINATGRARFFEYSALPNGRLPADFIANNPNTAAGILPSTTTRPSFWQDNGTEHQVTSDWDCRTSSQPSTLTTRP